MQNIKFVGTPKHLLNEELVSSVLINFASFDGHEIDTLEYNFIDSENVYFKQGLS